MIFDQCIIDLYICSLELLIIEQALVEMGMDAVVPKEMMEKIEVATSRFTEKSELAEGIYGSEDVVQAMLDMFYDSGGSA